MVFSETKEQVAHFTLEAFAARNNTADGNGSLCVQPLKVLKISIKERVFVVPFNLECEHPISGTKCFDMINFVGERRDFSLIGVAPLNKLPNLNVAFLPPVVG